MNEIIILYIIFILGYILEKKSINKLANYIGLVLIIAIILGKNNCEYISYILILVQISGLTIIFGFIIMLFGTTKIIPTIKNISIFHLIIWSMIILLLLFGLIYINSAHHEPMNWLWDIITKIKNITIFEINNININENIISNVDNNILLKISSQIFQEYFIRLFLIVVLLFFAIVALFFLLSPTHHV